MKRLIRRILNALAYAAAGLVIVLAILVGLFRLFLPRLPEYQEDIKTWANAAIGMQVEFSGMNARWRLSGPELNFYAAELSLPDAENSLIEAAEVTVGVGLLRLLFDRQLIVDRILVRDSNVRLEKTETDGLLVQGLTLDELAAMVPVSNESSDVVVIGRDIAVDYRDVEDQQILSFEIAMVEVSRDDDQLSLEASLNLEEGYGSRLDVSAEQRLLPESGQPIWQLYLEGRSLGLPRWSRFAPEGIAPVASGTGDISLWIELRDQVIDNATANFALDKLSVEGADRGAPVSVEGRLEYSKSAGGFLLAAENFRLRAVDLDWPRSSIQLQVDLDGEGPEAINANATYLRLDDAAYFSPWLPQQLREIYDGYRPSGEIRELRLGLSNLHNDDRHFDISATLEDAGLNASGDLPGVRNFSGGIRADNTGGRVEFDSGNLQVDLPAYVSDTMNFDDAVGTVIWRRSGDRLTVLSDRLHLRNADFDSQSSLQVTVAGDDASPVIDLQSQWSINDVASAKRFLPEPVIAPPLYQWLQKALVSGRMSNGSARLIGSLDAFPFDSGGGEFRIEATLEDAVMQYGNNWPAASIRSMDITLDGMRLFSEKNSAFTAGNSTVDAMVEFVDLRDPVLTIDAFLTGTLGSIRDYVRRSPIAEVFGGKLDSVSVAGDASFDLKLKLPLKAREDYDFTARIQVSDGSLALAGFAPPLSELTGIVEVTRDQLRSESLFGRFLGELMTIDLQRNADDLSAYGVVADAEGAVTAAGLINELGAPLEGLISGATPMQATVRFPRAGLASPPPVQIALRSDLNGLSMNLPAPLSKPQDRAYPLSLLIEFPDAEHIASNGSLNDDVRWASDFRRIDGRWDFDRGALAFGGDYPDYPGSRGLHIQGHTETVRVAEWLSLSRSGNGDGRVGARIRSIDLGIDHLYVLGQHIRDHRFSVDRGGNEWFVRANGQEINGTITIPYELGSDQPITLDMTTLILPGSDEIVGATDTAEGEATTLDPRSLPPISVKAEEFAFGDRFLGAVEAEFLRMPDGLRASSISARDPSFWIEGTAGWIVDETLEAKQQTYLSAKLVSKNIPRTMERLAYSPGLEGSDMEVDMDIRWPGPPRQNYLDVLNGEVSVRFGSGQLDEVEPGAGRVFGLMSVVALPRRLSLDFRDVFDKGFGFDEIKGSFTIDNGDAYTCDLSLKGPAADIVIVGRAGLASEDYHQTALVSANVGNTLPIVGTVVGGPQVGAALLIFSQIFKKPLQNMGQVYYAIDGSFADPRVEAANGQRFEETSSLAGCLADSR